MPQAFIGVDVIVGARGETDTCFDEAYRFIDSLDVSQLHVFPYSERPNTQALNIGHIVSPQEKQRRSHLLLNLSEQKLEQFYRSQQNTLHKVLFEQPKKGHPMHGFTENYIRVEIPFDATLVNQTRTVRLTEYKKNEQPAYRCVFV